MFFVNIFHLVITIVFIVCTFECSGFNTEKEGKLSSPRTKDEKVISSQNSTIDTAGFENGFKNMSSFGPLIFTRQFLKESMEKIQTTDNGVVTKSTFIPLVSQNSSGHNFTARNRSQTNQDRNKPTEVLAVRKNFRNLHNNSIIIRDGKKFRVFKIRKNFKNYEEGDTEKPKLVKNSLWPNLLSMLPLQWMTKGWPNKTEDLILRADNSTLWSKLSPIPTPEDHSDEKLKQGIENSEKIKKLLNLFTIVKFHNEECYANNVRGICLHASECEAKGWNFKASCAKDLGVCCYNEKTCGQESKENYTYFVNEGFPEPSAIAPQVCSLTLHKVDPEVKQFRIDFLNFQLRDPVNGTCYHDRLVVTGQDTNDVIPEICGVNTGQHIYADVEDSNGPINLNIISVGEYLLRNFQIKVTQLRTSNELAPKNCLQYYNQPTGIVQTFNYQHDINENIEEITTGYFNNLNYAICIKKLKGFCSLSYENEEEEGSIHPKFQLVNVATDGEKLLPPRQAGAETFDCPDDYIIVNGIRLCGEKLNDASVEINFTKNFPVTDTSNGPFIMLVRTDASVSGRGFSLKFSQTPCLTR